MTIMKIKMLPRIGIISMGRHAGQGTGVGGGGD